MRLFGWFRFPVTLRTRKAGRSHRLRRRLCLGWQSPGRQVSGIESLEQRWMLAVTISVSNPAPFTEPDSGTSDMVFIVTRSGNTAPDVKVDYTAVDGTAHAGTDYTATSGTLEFAPSVTSLPVNVPVIGNTIFQQNRSFTLALSNASGIQAPTFGNPQTFGVDSSPTGLTAADINGDGRKDLIVANAGSNSVSVLLNTTAAGATAPSFASEATFAVSANPFRVAVADINGDGKPDLIVTNGGADGVSVQLNTTATGSTTPSFALQQTFDTGATQDAVATADLNGDGRPDLIVTHGTGVDSVSVLLNTTTPGTTAASFAAQQTFAVGDRNVSIATADLNGDGKQDLIVTNYTNGTVSVLLNSTATGAAAASFAAQETFAAGTGPISVAVADINGDGLKDLVVANGGSNSISVLLDTTTPGGTAASFANQQTFAAGTAPISVIAVDLNGDGMLDVLVSKKDSTAAAVLVDLTTPGATTVAFAAAQTFTAGGTSFGGAAADLNGDGAVDMIVTNFSAGTVSVLLNTTSLPPTTPVTLLSPSSFSSAGTLPLAVKVADTNGDGKPDLIVANYSSGTVSVLLNTTVPGATAPSFAAAQTFSVGAAAEPSDVTLADFNGDGRPDLAVAVNKAPNSRLTVLVNTTAAGSTTVSFSTLQTFGLGVAHVRNVTAADLNGDGRKDLIVANAGSNSVSVLLNTTTPGATAASFAAPQSFAVGSNAYGAATADVNGDGKPDLIVANRNSTFSNTVSVLMNTTAPGATTASFTPQVTFATDRGPADVAAADVNGDGLQDLIVANAVAGTVSVLLNTTAPGATTASFAAALTFAAGTQPEAVTAVDLNGDGKFDILVADSDATGAALLVNQTTPGATTVSFAAAQTFIAGGVSFSSAAADLNGDGTVDIITADAVANTVSVLLNTFTTLTVSGSPATATILDDDEPDISGTWFVNGQAASIVQSGASLTFTNEHGGIARGSFTSPSAIVATEWGNLNGTLSNNNQTLTWSNGSVWTFVPPNIAGTWLINGKQATIGQNGSTLTFTNENGGTSAGLFISATQVEATGWGNLIGTLSNNNQTLSWSNGTVWTSALPNIAGAWQINGKQATIAQNGSTLSFTNENGGTSAGLFVTATEVQASDWGNLTGTLSNNNQTITWSNKSVWQRPV
jgi:hypothetical protein